MAAALEELQAGRFRSRYEAAAAAQRQRSPQYRRLGSAPSGSGHLQRSQVGFVLLITYIVRPEG